MNERQYREHWATLTGRPVRDVYVPLALREDPPLESVQAMLDRLTDGFRFGDDDDEED